MFHFHDPLISSAVARLADFTRDEISWIHAELCNAGGIVIADTQFRTEIACLLPPEVQYEWWCCFDLKEARESPKDRRT